MITVVGANWALLTYGIVPIGFGLDAPASVYFVGLTFTFRNVGKFYMTVVAVVPIVAWERGRRMRSATA